MKREQQKNNTNNMLVTTKGILDDKKKECLAGGKVRSKAGGPEMILVGFTTKPDWFEAKYLGSVLSANQLKYLAMKVVMNDEGQYAYYESFHTNIFYSNTSFENDKRSYPDGYKAEEIYKEYWSKYYGGWEHSISWEHRLREILKEHETGVINPSILAQYYKYKYNYSFNQCYCLCKYWSEKDEKFKHILLMPSEIEFI